MLWPSYFPEDEDPEAAVVHHETSGRQVSGHLQDGLAPWHRLSKKKKKKKNKKKNQKKNIEILWTMPLF